MWATKIRKSFFYLFFFNLCWKFNIVYGFRYIFLPINIARSNHCLLLFIFKKLYIFNRPQIKFKKMFKWIFPLIYIKWRVHKLSILDRKKVSSYGALGNKKKHHIAFDLTPVAPNTMEELVLNLKNHFTIRLWAYFIFGFIAWISSI